MTIEELKAEADKLGYRLIKKQEYIHLLPCVCGHNSRTRWWRMDGSFYECNQCGRRAPIGSTEAEAKTNWNKMVEEAENERKENNA